MSNKNSFEYYGLWEEINNENFNSVEFHRIRKGSLKIFVLIALSFIVLFIGFNSKDVNRDLTLVGEILTIVGEGILGFLLENF